MSKSLYITICLSSKSLMLLLVKHNVFCILLVEIHGSGGVGTGSIIASMPKHLSEVTVKLWLLISLGKTLRDHSSS